MTFRTLACILAPGRIRLETLHCPLSIDSVRDGGAYFLEHAPLTRTNLFLRVGLVDELFFKLPSERGWADYRRFIRFAQTHSQDLRPLDASERFENLPPTLASFPRLSGLTACHDPEIVHYLLVHKLQYEKIRNQTAVGIPLARFGLLSLHNRGPARAVEPALFQERVPGATLWDAYDFDRLRVKPEWQPHLPIISIQLSNFLDSGLLHHVDWNIRNFVFDVKDERLFYVDLKPSTFVARSSNEHNLRGVRDYFLV